MKNIAYRTTNPLFMWLIVAVGFWIIFHFASPRFVFPRYAFTPFLIVPGIMYWAYFLIGALRVHHKAPLSVDKIDMLITDGVYGIVRHPIYAADIVLGWSIFFSYPDVRFLIGAHWMMFVLLFWMRREEKMLIDKFGDVYKEYTIRVPKIFPRVWSK